MNLSRISVLIAVVLQLFHFGADGEKVCSCYIFETGASASFGWPHAKGSCKYYNKHLVVLETEREWEFINKEIQTRTSVYNINEWYIGLYRNRTTGNWTWINGKPLTIDKWQTGKPTDRDFYTLIAKEYPPGHKGSFNSIRGSLVNRGWICEEETDNCQGVCLSHKLVPKSSTPTRTTIITTSTAEMKTSTAYHHTDVSDGEKVCSCYIFETGASASFGWPQAEGSCKYNNTHLVVLETEREWEVINKEIQTRTSFDNRNEWYIGLYRNRTTGNWTWINGKPLTIDKWQKGKPNDRDFYTLIAKEWPTGHKGSFNSIDGRLVNRGWICEEETDNCQGVCLFHKLVPKSSTPPRTTITTSTAEMKTSTAYHHTDVSADSTTTTSITGVSGQKGDDEKCSTIVIITTSLAAVLFFVVVVLSVVLLLILRRTKLHQKDHVKVVNCTCCIYKKTSSPGQQSTGHVQLESSAELTGHVTLSRTEAGLATYETLNDRRHECAYATLDKANLVSTFDGGELDGAEKQTQSDDGYCVPSEQSHYEYCVP